jgi:hypothetical protein
VQDELDAGSGCTLSSRTRLDRESRRRIKLPCLISHFGGCILNPGEICGVWWVRAGLMSGYAHPVYAVLIAEDDSPYDASAVAVWVQGLKVGHLSRANARRYRPGLLGLQRRYGQPVALSGVIVGGGIREDGPGRLGVFLRHDPTDFGL